MASDIGVFEILLGAQIVKSIVFELLAEYRSNRDHPMTKEEYMQVKPLLDTDLELAMAKIRAH